MGGFPGRWPAVGVRLTCRGVVSFQEGQAVGVRGDGEDGLGPADHLGGAGLRGRNRVLHDDFREAGASMGVPLGAWGSHPQWRITNGWCPTR